MAISKTHLLLIVLLPLLGSVIAGLFGRKVGRVGAHSAFAGCVGVAGSATIGRFCTAGGGAIILGHLEIVDHVHVSAATVITRSILKPGTYSGMFPFDDNAAWEKNAATLRQLHALRDRLRALEKRT